MKKTFLIFALALGFVLYGCNNGTSKAVAEEVAEVTNDEDHDHGDHHEVEVKERILSLNNGQKWEINKEMTPHVIAAEEVLATYMEEGSTDYAQLAADLKEENANLIRSCTMKGESHDQLHVWLEPHIDLLGDLGNAGSVEEATAVVDKINQSFATFHEYFE